VKFERTARFDNDYKRLLAEHKQQFKNVVRDFNAACDNYVANPGGFIWPKSLRVSQMTSASRVWEMTWSFSSPDGRATFEFVHRDDEVRVLWRRIGDHRIYRTP
jgi:hypothetical protein